MLSESFMLVFVAKEKKLKANDKSCRAKVIRILYYFRITLYNHIFLLFTENNESPKFNDGAFFLPFSHSKCFLSF